MKSLGLKQSAHDPCLLFREDLIVICYVDDLGFQAPNQGVIDKVVAQLRNKGFELTIEGTFTEYLGIQYNKIDEHAIEMNQQGLIDKILKATGMENCNPNKIPAAKSALGADPDGSPMKDKWNY